MTIAIAYLSQGKLFVRQPDGSRREIESPFGQEIVNRELRSQELNSWKTEDSQSPFGGRMLWGGASPGDAMPVVVTGLTRGGSGEEVTYLLFTGVVGGLLTYNLSTDRERRLFHKAQFHGSDLAMCPDRQRIACSVSHSGGTVNIAVMEADGRDLRQVTEGDTVDEAPSWVPGKDGVIVYQSSGIGRNQSGHFAVRGPAAIEQLDLERNTLTTVAEDPDHDYLMPRMDAAGNLYFIRRPYQGLPRPTFGKVMLDIVLFPFRLARAVVHFLNMFSLLFSRKPLITAGRPHEQNPTEMTRFMLYGQLVEADKILSKQSVDSAPSLVPKDWELVRRGADGEESVLARGVLAFDLAGDGIVYTNGTGVFQRDGAGKETRLFTDSTILNVVALDEG